MTTREYEGGREPNGLSDKAGGLQQDLRNVGEKLSPERIADTARGVVASAQDAAAHAGQQGAALYHDARDAAVESYRTARDYTIEEAHELREQARRAAYATADYTRRAGASTAEFVTANAVPLTLIGAGIGWLAWSLRKQSQARLDRNDLSFDSTYEDDFDPSLEGTYPLRARAGNEGPRTSGVRDAAEQARTRVGAIAERASQSASALADRASHSASALADRATHGVDAVRSRVTDAASHLGEQASELSYEARERLRLASLRTRDFADENPLVVGAIAIAAGVGVGLLLPSTQPENRLLGETRDRLLGDARHVLDDARGVLDEAKTAALETASQVGQRAREAAQEVRGQAEQARNDSRISH